VAISWWIFLAAPEIFYFPSAVQEVHAGISTPVTGVNPGWSHNRQNVVFYNGSRFFLLYSKGDGNIYYKSSTDNVTWTNESTLLVSAGNNFNIYLVNDTKFDLVYGATYVRTCTISGETITPGAASLVELISHHAYAVARSGGGDRIYVVGQFNNDFLRIYRADQTGNATTGTSWTKVLEDQSVNPTAVTIVPYQGIDKVLVVYTLDAGGTNNDGVYSRWVTGTGVGGRCRALKTFLVFLIFPVLFEFQIPISG